MKNYLLLFLIFCLIACSDEEESCSHQDFIGTWRVVNSICSIDNSSNFEIVAGDFNSRIKMKLGQDTLEFIVIDCVAAYKTSDFLTETKATMKLSNDEIKLEYTSQVLILPIICNLTLRK